MAPSSVRAADVVSLTLSLGAASLSAAVLYAQYRAAKRAAPVGAAGKPDKKEKHLARCRAVETLIMNRGEANTKDFRVHVLAKGEEGASNVAELSLWHDVPLVAEARDAGDARKLFNFICEIPKCTRKKFEVATMEGATPIKQDLHKDGVLREFKKGDIFFNYGCFPRTWEDPRVTCKDTGCPGDNDPLDVCEIGLRQVRTGEIRAVKVLGVLAMIDDGETDWKIVAIDAADMWAPALNDIDDVERLLPGTVSLIREWFRTYKIADGKPPNRFALNEECRGAAYAHKVIHETHAAWYELVANCAGADLGFQLPRLETLRDVAVDTRIVRSLSQQNLAGSA